MISLSSSVIIHEKKLSKGPKETPTSIQCSCGELFGTDRSWSSHQLLKAPFPVLTATLDFGDGPSVDLSSFLKGAQKALDKIRSQIRRFTELLKDPCDVLSFVQCRVVALKAISNYLDHHTDKSEQCNAVAGWLHKFELQLTAPSIPTTVDQLRVALRRSERSTPVLKSRTPGALRCASSPVRTAV
jgi:hypothetical protein